MTDRYKSLLLRFEDADTMLSIDAQKIALLVNGMYDRFFARYSPERKEDTPLILEAFEDFALLADIAVEQAEHLKEHAQCLTDAVKDGYKMLWAEQAETHEGPAIERLADALRSGTATPDQIEAAAGLLTRWAALLADVDTMTAYSAHYVELLAKNYLKLDRQRGFIPDSTKGGAEHDGGGAGSADSQ